MPLKIEACSSLRSDLQDVQREEELESVLVKPKYKWKASGSYSSNNISVNQSDHQSINQSTNKLIN